MRVRVLGPVTVETDEGARLSRRDRLVLAALVLSRASVVPAERLADAAYGDDPPPTWRKVLQNSIVRLRRALGPRAIETTAAGYRLTLGDEEIDSRRFERLVTDATERAVKNEFGRVVALLTEALSLFLGRPLSDLDDWEPGQAEARRLEELRRVAEERLVDALLADGRPQEAATLLTRMTAQEPYREQRWASLALAQYRAGSPTDALRSIREARGRLSNELGVDPGPRLDSMERALLHHDKALMAGTVRKSLPSADCPYRGLASFGAADADTFFGRDEESAAAVARVLNTGFVALVGPSGCGKSSLACAGVAPRLARRGRSVTVIVPGLDALAQLAAADPSAVLVVDQFEELATSDADHGMQAAFAGELAERCARTPVIVTVRADAMAWVSTLTPLRGLVERGIHLVAPMDERGLRAAIDEPARRAGLRVETGLADLMIRDVEGRPGALPLLSHALAETWLRRSGDTLTIEGYRAGGGVGGAVAATAERVFGELTPAGRETARALLLRLVSLNDEGAPIRHRLRLDDTVGGPEQADVAAALSSARLLTVDVDTVEVNHEVLARAWPRLKSWLEDGRDAARVMEHLAAAAQEWERTGRDDTELYRGARLRIAEELAAQKDAVLAATERTFLKRSLEQRRDDEANLAAQVIAHDRANRRLLRLLAIVVILLVVTSAVGAIALVQRSRADSAQLSAQRSARDSALRDVVARSLVLRASKRDLGALLAVEAYRLAPSSQTESALFATFTGSPGYVRPIRVDAHNLEVGALLPDGSTLAVTDENAEVRLVDIRSGTQVAALAPLRKGVGNTTLSLSTDGRYLAVAQAAASSPDAGSLTVWDLATRQRRFPDVALPFPPGSVAISGDGTLVAVGGGPSARVQVRSAVSGSLVVEPPAIPRPGGAILHIFTVGVLFTPDGHLLAGSQAGVIRLLDSRTGVELRRIDGPRETSENILRLTRDGTSLLTSGARGAMRFDLASGRALWAAAPALRCNSFAVAERIGTVLCGDTAGRVTGIDLATGAQVGHKYDSQQGSVSDLILGADGSSLVEVSADAPVCAVWDLVGGGPASRLLPSGDETVVDGYTADGSLILVEDRAAPEATRVRLIDATTGAVIDPLEGVTRAGATSDPARLLAVFDDGTTGFYDVRAHQRASQRISLPFTPESISAAGTRSLVWAQGRLRVIDSVTGAVVQPAVDDPTPIFAAAHSDGGHLVTLGINGLELRDDNTGKPAGPRFADAQDVAPVGKMLVVATGDGRLLLLDPNNLQVAGPPLPSVGGNTDVVDASSDGRRAAVLGFDRALRAVDVTGREVIGDAVELGSGGGGAALRPDGLRMAAGTRLGVVTWDLDPAHWLDAACSFAGRDLTPAEWGLYLAPLGTYQSACPARSS